MFWKLFDSENFDVFCQNSANEIMYGQYQFSSYSRCPVLAFQIYFQLRSFFKNKRIRKFVFERMEGNFEKIMKNLCENNHSLMMEYFHDEIKTQYVPRLSAHFS